ncbi:MAG: ribosome biogenesis GTPase Der [Desulfovibrionaceae bacterium]|nr:ribosome biogenesis GTPase Der [Desulfovibrionaceae bacterium]
MPPKIALIGRPNVGKSTLFNRLCRRRKAITHDRAGVTRDRKESLARLDGREVVLIDTGGILPGAIGGIEAEIVAQANFAIGEAALCLLVVDAREGLNPLDAEVAGMLRSKGKLTLVAVNKADGAELQDRLAPDFYALGFPLAAVSAAHGLGIDDLTDRIVEMLPPASETPEISEDDTPRDLRLALIGRPNAGKSSILNALAGQSRVIVSAEAGTTRDSVDAALTVGGKRVVFVDTAGVRRKSRIEDSLEKLTKKADVTCLVLDAPAGLASQDKKLIDFLDREKVPFLVLANKIDLVAKKDMADFKKDLSQALSLCQHAPVLFVSALAATGLSAIVTKAGALRAEAHRRIGTGELNRAAREALEKHQAPIVKGRRAKFYYLTQADVNPPTFVFFVNDPERVTPTYARYLENKLRSILNLRHAPLKLLFRGSHADPEAAKK